MNCILQLAGCLRTATKTCPQWAEGRRIVSREEREGREAAKCAGYVPDRTASSRLVPPCPALSRVRIFLGRRGTGDDGIMESRLTQSRRVARFWRQGVGGRTYVGLARWKNALHRGKPRYTDVYRANEGCKFVMRRTEVDRGSRRSLHVMAPSGAGLFRAKPRRLRRHRKGELARAGSGGCRTIHHNKTHWRRLIFFCNAGGRVEQQRNQGTKVLLHGQFAGKELATDGKDFREAGALHP
jgi:hypothetical protein